jgi:hypothetical protein
MGTTLRHGLVGFFALATFACDATTDLDGLSENAALLTAGEGVDAVAGDIKGPPPIPPCIDVFANPGPNACRPNGLLEDQAKAFCAKHGLPLTSLALDACTPHTSRLLHVQCCPGGGGGGGGGNPTPTPPPTPGPCGPPVPPPPPPPPPPGGGGGNPSPTPPPVPGADAGKPVAPPPAPPPCDAPPPVPVPGGCTSHVIDNVCEHIGSLSAKVAAVCAADGAKLGPTEYGGSCGFENATYVKFACCK